MSKTLVQPKQLGFTVLSLALALAASLLFAASSLAAPGPVALKVTPSPVAFGKTTVGERALKEVTISNEGETVEIENLSIEGEGAGEFGFSAGCSKIVEGEDCSLTLEFRPGSSGPKQGHVLILFKEGLRPTESFDVSGEAVAPHLRFSPSSYDFGPQPVNQGAAQQSFQLENDGEAPVQVNNVELAEYGSFWFDFNPSCNRLMAPGESCSFQVYFGPNNGGSYSDELRAYAGGENFSAQLSGEGVRPEIEVNPFPVEFGAATVGTSGATRTVTVSNVGQVATGFFIAVISGGDAGSFRLLDETCTGHELQPGGSCSARIHFAPLAAGASKATLSMFGEGDGGMQAPLLGEGVAPALSLSAGFDFGPQAKGANSPFHTFAVRNDGATPVSVTATALVGANLDQFLLGGDECTGVTLANGQECLLRVRFAPATVGAKTATLRVSSEVGALTASLAGTAQNRTSAAADSRSHRRRARFLRGASLSAAKARCHRHRACRKAASAGKHRRSHSRPR